MGKSELKTKSVVAILLIIVGIAGISHSTIWNGSFLANLCIGSRASF